MICLILAAGYATRLYPLTENFPKPLLKIGNSTILDMLIDDIENSKEIEKYVVISNHKFIDIFNKWALMRKENILVIDDGTTSNDNRLGAVKDIQFAIDNVNIRDDILIIAGDNVLDFSLKHLIEYSKKKKASCVMRYFEEDKKKISKSGCLVIDENEKVLIMQEKPPEPESNWCCPPFYYYTSEDTAKIKNAIADGCATDAPGGLIEWLCKHSEVYAMEMPGKRYDVGDIKSYENVISEFENKG